MHACKYVCYVCLWYVSPSAPIKGSSLKVLTGDSELRGARLSAVYRLEVRVGLLEV